MFPWKYNRALLPYECVCLKITISYFTYDTIFGFFKGYNDFWTYFHHFAAGSASALALYFGMYATETVPSIFIGEFSNPFLILRTLFEFHDMKRSGMAMGGMLCFTYIALRGVLVPWLMYMCQMSDTPLWMKLYSSAMWFVSLLWLWKIVNLGMKALSGVSFLLIGKGERVDG